MVIVEVVAAIAPAAVSFIIVYHNVQWKKKIVIPRRVLYSVCMNTSAQRQQYMQKFVTVSFYTIWRTLWTVFT